MSLFVPQAKLLTYCLLFFFKVSHDINQEAIAASSTSPRLSFASFATSRSSTNTKNDMSRATSRSFAENDASRAKSRLSKENDEENKKSFTRQPFSIGPSFPAKSASIGKTQEAIAASSSSAFTSTSSFMSSSSSAMSTSSLKKSYRRSFSNKRNTTSELEPSRVKLTQTSSVKNDASAKSGRLSSTSLIPKSSGGSSSKVASVEILTSNMHGGVLKTLQCHPKAAQVIEHAVASFPNNAHKQVVSVAAIAHHRNSHGTNAQLHNIMSLLCYFIPIMTKKDPTKFPGRFIADKPDLLSEAQNVVTKFKLVDPQGIGCSCQQFMQIFRSPTAKAIFSAKMNAREDYGDASFFEYCKKLLSEFGVLLVLDGGYVNATNAKDKRMLILSEHLKPDNVQACKALTASNDNQFNNQRFDCIQPGCIRAQECAKHCKAHKPTVSV